MSTHSFVGVLHPDGDTYQARFALFDGDPDTMPYVIAAVWWHTFGCDSTATVAALLAHDWEQVGADIVVGTPPSMDGYQPIPGVGMAMPAADTAPEPVTGRLTDPAPDHGVEWMYLIDRTNPGRLAICHHGRRWTIRHRLDLTVGRDIIVG
jgi:hypothetical protein